MVDRIRSMGCGNGKIVRNASDTNRNMHQLYQALTEEIKNADGGSGSKAVMADLHLPAAMASLDIWAIMVTSPAARLPAAMESLEDNSILSFVETTSRHPVKAPCALPSTTCMSMSAPGSGGPARAAGIRFDWPDRCNVVSLELMFGPHMLGCGVLSLYHAAVIYSFVVHLVFIFWLWYLNWPTSFRISDIGSLGMRKAGCAGGYSI